MYKVLNLIFRYDDETIDVSNFIIRQPFDCNTEEEAVEICWSEIMKQFDDLEISGGIEDKLQALKNEGFSVVFNTAVPVA